MGVQFTANTQNLSRAATYLNRAVSWTRFLWCWQGPSSAGTDFRQYFVDGDPAFSGNSYIYLGSGNVNVDKICVETFDGATTLDSAEFTPPISTWFWVAEVYNSVAHTLTFIANGATIGAITINLSAVTFTTKTQEVNGAPIADLATTFIREWQAALTGAELTAEAKSSLAVRTTSLLSDTTLVTASSLSDRSGHSRDWTAAGSPVTLAGPFPGAESAVSVATLPAAETAAMGTNPEAWFSYIAASNDVELSAFASADGSGATVGLGIYTGTAGAPILYQDLATALRQPLAPPVTASTTYFFRIVNPTAPTPLGVNAAFSLQSQPVLFIPAGSVLIGDDSFTNPPVIVSATSANVLGIPNIIGGNQFLDTVSSGIVLSDNESVSGQLRRFAADDLSEQTPIALVSAPTIDGIRSDRNDTFFVATTHSGTATVYAISGAGVVSGTTWVLPHSAFSFAPSQDDTILYWARYTGVASDMAVQRWDLVNDVALSNLVAADSPYFVTQDMLSLPDGSVLVGYAKSGDFQVRHISAGGTLLNTYEFGAEVPDAQLNFRMTLALDQTSFWLKTNPIQGTTADTQLLQQVQISDGAILQSLTFPTFTFGVGPATSSPTAPARFGPGPSTPITTLMARVGPPVGGTEPPPFTTITYPVRRVRQSPHLSNLQLQQFFSMFQLDIEAGRGLVDGSDPQIMLSWSDDGGHTWSQEHWVGAGKIGEFKRRAIWRRLGKSRDRVWRVVVDAPIPWRILQAFAAVEEGTS